MMENVVEIPLKSLIEIVKRMKEKEHRFVAITCVDLDSKYFDLIYHFDKEMELFNIRVKVGKDEKVPSITEIYFCALLAENEVKELFGVEITDIVVDYKGKLLLTENFKGCAPMGRQITVVQEGETKNG